MRAYLTELWQTASTDVRSFWTAHRAATSMTGGIIGFLASAFFKGLHGSSDILQALAISILAALGAFVVTFVVSLVKAPKLLDDARRSEIKRLEDENKSLLPKPATAPARPRHYDQVKASIVEIGSDAEIVLRHLGKHVQLTLMLPSGGSSGPPSAQSVLPEGMKETPGTPLKVASPA